ncbi:hypothetical protein [Phycicoccus sp. SLBN-51]|uniref:hypothetical protein n=1 Tax=Phycicoccus sp. SLBN-51 TaxID=2768447 RepID=UPI001169CC4D|nr:hypothetical protein [Phycicoccus sp. SLBN-51]TQJ49510.1 hypothetical protein FBY26_1193 [Phycicoccus sp. SLBN-51]
MSEKPQDEQVPGGGLSGNEDGASSDGDSGPSGKGGGAGGKGGAPSDEEAREDEAQPG